MAHAALAAWPLVLAVVFALLWARSVWWVGDLIIVKRFDGGRNWVVISQGGGISAGWALIALGDRRRNAEKRWEYRHIGREPTDWEPYVYTTTWNKYLIINIPYWTIIVSLLAAYLWRSIRSRRQLTKHGVCSRCEYDLTGNPAALSCPECGEPIKLPSSSEGREHET